jgi:hypothetical protein
VTSGLTIIQQQVLTALAEGYAARQGMKDRIRALNEWEIARRAGLTEASYAVFSTDPTRDEISAALSALQRSGLVSVWDHGAKYDSFVPTPGGSQLVAGSTQSSRSPLADGPILDARRDIPNPDPSASIATVDQAAIVERLDEMIRLLRSIDAKLGGR